jgi:hypothetical protein
MHHYNIPRGHRWNPRSPLEGKIRLADPISRELSLDPVPRLRGTVRVEGWGKIDICSAIVIRSYLVYIML